MGDVWGGCGAIEGWGIFRDDYLCVRRVASCYAAGPKSSAEKAPHREEIDGFFAALICSPDFAKPSEYLPEIWGEEMSYDEAFIDREQLLDFLGLLMRHWDSIVRILHEQDVFAPLLFHGEGGIAHANDWA